MSNDMASTDPTPASSGALPPIVRAADLVKALAAVADAMARGVLSAEEAQSAAAVLEHHRKAVETSSRYPDDAGRGHVGPGRHQNRGVAPAACETALRSALKARPMDTRVRGTFVA
jgi:hypothetical protein